MNREDLKTLSKDQIPTLAKQLGESDINFLVAALEEKEDTTRYKAFLLLQAHSQEASSLYGYWGELEKKLENPNSYQRSIGLMLIAENVRWDKDGKFDGAIGKYLKCCMDEKFITARQTIQGLAGILNATNAYDDVIKQNLLHLSFVQYKENQQKLLNKDTANVLKIIENKAKQKPKAAK
jgi:hypothetical protein